MFRCSFHPVTRVLLDWLINRYTKSLSPSVYGVCVPGPAVTLRSGPVFDSAVVERFFVTADLCNQFTWAARPFNDTKARWIWPGGGEHHRGFPALPGSMQLSLVLQLAASSCRSVRSLDRAWSLISRRASGTAVELNVRYFTTSRLRRAVCAFLCCGNLNKPTKRTC
ncbi:hypothetical protein VTK56DRAFT_5197 [Thermocarpiscus australiensis]